MAFQMWKSLRWDVILVKVKCEISWIGIKLYFFASSKGITTTPSSSSSTSSSSAPSSSSSTRMEEIRGRFDLDCLRVHEHVLALGGGGGLFGGVDGRLHNLRVLEEVLRLLQDLDHHLRGQLLGCRLLGGRLLGGRLLGGRLLGGHLLGGRFLGGRLLGGRLLGGRLLPHGHLLLQGSWQLSFCL